MRQASDASTQHPDSPILLKKQGGSAEGQRDERWQPRGQRWADDSVAAKIACNFNSAHKA